MTLYSITDLWDVVSTNGERDVDRLLSDMHPVFRGEQYVFCCVDRTELSKLSVTPRMLFDEEDGVTLVLTKKDADECGFAYEAVWSLITLGVYSDLEAIGFLAPILRTLANARIPVNVASAFYHDHIFVPESKTSEAMRLLERLSSGSKKER